LEFLQRAAYRRGRLLAAQYSFDQWLKSAFEQFDLKSPFAREVNASPELALELRVPIFEFKKGAMMNKLTKRHGVKDNALVGFKKNFLDELEKRVKGDERQGVKSVKDAKKALAQSSRSSPAQSKTKPSRVRK
jgi:alpha-amylase/alpha-mannosidase (GH57 family)